MSSGGLGPMPMGVTMHQHREGNTRTTTKMLSRTQVLIKKEYVEVQQLKISGIGAFEYAKDNIFEWTGTITGLKDTPWEGGKFEVKLKFGHDYNNCPPEVKFVTIPFHPNVDAKTGQPCLRCLEKEHWSHNCTALYILIHLQELLSHPDPEEAVNLQAANLLLSSPRAYRQAVLDCVLETIRFQAGVSDMQLCKDCSGGSKNRDVIEQSSVPSRPRKLSFEEYQAVWQRVGTASCTDRTDKKNQANPTETSLQK
ncbi:PREDICTED: ubiquitin-conjugating enzyme E2 1-like [Priapulus caudatus]|uniref:Ubiquitin-conjugating enzyme E2 1-like n=1 Tax=Priapulus caudatus TaxID=37621 RepID=A0ABM1F805_PRICU|nr:PREDICTED: ubiquitin-conjugating enzyme E2 1-like [Priapulus caudatus]